MSQTQRSLSCSQSLPTSITLGCKGWPRVNTLAYFPQASVTKPNKNLSVTDDSREKLECLLHRDKTRVQMPAKIFPQLKVKC